MKNVFPMEFPSSDIKFCIKYINNLENSKDNNFELIYNICNSLWSVQGYMYTVMYQTNDIDDSNERDQLNNLLDCLDNFISSTDIFNLETDSSEDTINFYFLDLCSMLCSILSILLVSDSEKKEGSSMENTFYDDGVEYIDESIDDFEDFNEDDIKDKLKKYNDKKEKLNNIMEKLDDIF